MDVRCEKCSTEYEFDENRIGANGVTVKCTACGFVFKVRRPKKVAPPRATTTLGKGPQGREWLVRKPDGQMIAFRELTTLQKWIVEGRINRDDEISKNGETWKRLGNILELEPFFSVYEKARALNDLMEKGGSNDGRVELRGSEVLATMDPLSQLPLDAELASSASIGPEYAHGTSFSNTQRAHQPPYPVVHGSPAMPPPPPPASNSPSASQENLPTGAGPALTMPLPMPSAPPRNNGFGGNGTGSMPRRSSTPGVDLMPRSRSTPAGDTMPVHLSGPSTSTPIDHRHPTMAPMAGPAVLEGPPPMDRSLSRPPPGWGTNPLSINLEDTGTPRPDIVDRFERQQKMKRAFAWIAVLVVLGLGGGVALAKFGPQGNPLQQIAERYGLLSPKTQDDAATPHIADAHKNFDLDTLSSLQKAEGLLELAQSLRPDDPRVRGDRALVMMTRVDALRRTAADLGLQADEADRMLAEQKPVKIDPKTLREQIGKNSDAASTLAKQAFELAASSYKMAPEAYEPARALAEYYRVQQDYSSFARELTRAKTVTAKSGENDGALMYIEAASLLNGPRILEGDVAKGIALAEQALTARPSMNRARVLLARAQLSKKNNAAAKAELDKVLAIAPDHEEALRLKAALETPPATPAAEEKPTQAAQQQPAQQQAQTQVAAEKTPDQPKGDSYDALMAEADRSRERDKPKKALAAYEKAHDLKPASAEPLTGMGWSYIDLDNPQAALSSFKRAIKANDRFVEAHFGEAEAHRMLGETDQAIAAYETYLAKAPSGPDRKAAERALAQLKK